MQVYNNDVNKQYSVKASTLNSYMTHLFIDSSHTFSKKEKETMIGIKIILANDFPETSMGMGWVDWVRGHEWRAASLLYNPITTAWEKET